VVVGQGDAAACVAHKQEAISIFHLEIAPILNALGEAGTMLRARLAMLMFDSGLVEGSSPPETEHQLCQTVLQALDTLRRCAGNALVAPILEPRSSAVRSAAANPGDKRQLSLGSSEMQALLASTGQEWWFGGFGWGGFRLG